MGDNAPPSNLKDIFKQMRGFISANATGTTRDEKILGELMSILICKIYDERYKSDEDYMEFRIVNDDDYVASVEKRRFRSHMSLDTAIEFLNNQDLSNVKAIYALHLSKERAERNIVKKELQRATGKEVIIC